MLTLLAIIGVVCAVASLVWILFELARWPALGVYLLVFFLPFERIPSLVLAGFTVRVNHLIGAVALLIWALSVLAGRKKIVPNPLIAPVAIFGATLVLSSLYAHDATRALAVTFATFATMAIGFLLPQLLTKREQIRPTLLVLGGTTIIAMIFGMYQFVGDFIGLPLSMTGLIARYSKEVFGFARIQAFSQEPLYFGNFLLVGIAVALAFILVKQTWFPRQALSIFLVSALGILAMTLSRGAIVGFAGVLFVTMLLLGKRFLTLRNFALVVVGFALAASIVLAGISLTGDTAREKFLAHLTIQDFGKAESTVGRLETWFQAIDLWLDKPVLGVGPGNFGPAILGYPAIKPETGWPVVNNQYLELLAETGLIGTSIFLLFLFFLIVRSVRAYGLTAHDPEMRAVLVGLTAAIFGMLLQYNFFSTLYITFVWISFGLLMAIQGIILSTRKVEPYEV